MKINTIKNLKIVFFALLILLTIFSVWYLRYTWNVSIAETSNRALTIAQTSEIALNGEMFKQLRAVPEDISTVPYTSVKKRLMQLPTVDKSVRFVALIVQKSDKKLYFMADSEPTSSDDYSPPGQEFAEADPQYYQPFVDGKTLITKPATDRWGTWVTVLVPMKDADTKGDIEIGEVLAVFAVAYPASNWNDSAVLRIEGNGFMLFVLYMLLLTFYTIIKNNFKLREDEFEITNHATELEKFKLAVDNTSNHVVITDTNAVILYANHATELITGFNVNEILGKKAGSRELWGGQMEKDEYEKMWKTIKVDKKTYSGEVKNRRKNGEDYTAQTTISPVLDQNGNVVFFVEIQRDISKEKEIDKMKSEFIGIASHQLKTPLSEIKWVSEFLLEDINSKKTAEQNRKYLMDIHESNEKLIRLVVDFLDVSHIETGLNFIGEKKPTNITKLIDDVLEENKKLYVEKNINIIKCQGLKEELFLNIDGEKIMQVFENLINNAVKYSRDDSEVEVCFEKQKDEIIFSVKDRGIGIPKNQQKRIFERFFRADNARKLEKDGTGLGLYIIKRIVEAHDGRLWFESAEDKGTTFYFSLKIS